jgi:excinuclease ABC subunit C
MIRREDYRTSEMTAAPGVYVFRDRFGTVLYVGKAKSLRKRLSSYFQPSRKKTADPRIRSLINSIDSVEVQEVRNEQEALMLESRLIKTYAPRFNVLLRDDKRFLLLKINREAPYPRLQLARLRKDDGCLYVGPFPHAGALRDTLNELTRQFGLRTCTAEIPGEQEFKHCNDHVVRFCTAPCLQKITPEAYRERVDQLVAVLQGNTKGILADLRERMTKAAERHDFEKAARLRDTINNIEVVCRSNRTFVRASLSTFPGQEGVEDLQGALGLKQPPARIECFDISNTFGAQAVASMVSFQNGEPDRKNYRRFRIKEVEGINDFAMMQEVVTRRYRRLLDENKPLPDLIVVDGGRGQLNAGWQALIDAKATHVPMVGLAKRLEEIFTLEDEAPILLGRDRPGLKLMQAIRDEAHRFAVSFHRDLRRQRILDSMLDEIPGIGEERRKLLLKAFGSVSNLRRQTPEKICQKVPGIGPKLAETVLGHLKKA